MTAIPEVTYHQHGVDVTIWPRPDKVNCLGVVLSAYDWMGRKWNSRFLLDSRMNGQQQADIIRSCAQELLHQSREGN